MTLRRKDLNETGQSSQNGSQGYPFTKKEVEQLEKALEDTKGAYPTRDVVQSLVDKFNATRGHAGKVPVKAKQVLRWFNKIQRPKKGKDASVPETSNSAATTFKDVPTNIAPTNYDEVLSDWDPIAFKELEFEARSSTDGAWYDVDHFVKHRILKSGEKKVRVRFAGFTAQNDEWITVKDTAVRVRSLPCEGFDCLHIKQGDLICCFQEGIEEAKYFDAHVENIERKQHDEGGCRCMFSICYDHNKTKEIVPLQRVYRRPEDNFLCVTNET